MCFCVKVMAVGFYELHLDVPEERWVAQELIHLAMMEPGENTVETEYNGSDLDIPAPWAQDLPNRGVLSFYYCREQKVIEKVARFGSYHSTGYPYAIDGEIPELHQSHYGVWYLKVRSRVCLLGLYNPATRIRE